MKSKLLLITIVLAVFFGGKAFCAPSVFVAQPQIFNAPEVASSAEGIRSMVAGRVAGTNYRVDTGEAPAPDASYTLKLTITQLMGAFSVDAALEPLVEGGQGARVSERADKSDQLMTAIEKVSENIKAKLALAINAQPTPVVGSKPAQTPAKTFEPASLFKSPKILLEIPGEVKSLVKAQVSTGGAQQFVALIDKTLYLLEYKDGKFYQAGKFEPDLDFKPLYLSAFDLDGDKTDELLVFGSSMASGYTQAYKFDGRGFIAFGKRARAFVRAIDAPNGKSMTALKCVGGVDVFQKPLYRATFDGAEFVYGEPMAAPEINMMPVNVDWLSFGAGQPTWIFAIDQDNRLSIFDAKLNRVYRGDDIIKGSTTRIEGEIRDRRNDSYGDIYALEPATFTLNAPDGSVYAIVHDNIDESNFIPRRWGSYSKGALLALQWDGLALQKSVKSADFEGYFAGIARLESLENPDTSSILAVLIKDEGMIITSKISKFVAFGL